MSETREKEGREFSGEDTRQGEIILRSKRRKAVFILGLAGIVILAILLRLGGIY